MSNYLLRNDPTFIPENRKLLIRDIQKLLDNQNTNTFTEVFGLEALSE